MNNMFGNSNYGAFGTYPYPTQTDNFARTYGQTPYNNGMAQQMQMNPQPNGNFYYVNGIEGAKAFMVQANSTAMLLDSDSNKIFIKTANQQGQATLREFELHEISPQNALQKENSAKPINYVEKEQFDLLSTKYEELDKKIKSISDTFASFTERFTSKGDK